SDLRLGLPSPTSPSTADIQQTQCHNHQQQSRQATHRDPNQGTADCNLRIARRWWGLRCWVLPPGCSCRSHTASMFTHVALVFGVSDSVNCSNVAQGYELSNSSRRC